MTKISVIFKQAAMRWAEMSADYMDYVDDAYDKALNGTGGVLLNKEGRALHLDGYDLMRGSKSRAMKYASEELLAWWEEHPRLSLAEFEEQWVSGSYAYS